MAGPSDCRLPRNLDWRRRGGGDGGGGGDGDVRDVQFTAVLVAAASSQGLGPPLSLGGTDFENGGRKQGHHCG